jgi:ribosomal protein S12 methylthiotransferase accessory factor YcaO
MGRSAQDGECDASGLAAGTLDEEQRVWRHGLREVLERDALMLAWRLSDWPKIKLDTNIVGDHLSGFCQDSSLEIRLYEIGDPSLVPVVLCLLRDPRGGLTCGSACEEDVEHSVQKAVLEAIMLWHVMREDPLTVSLGSPISTSVDHVRYAWQNADRVWHWFENLPTRMYEVEDRRTDGLLERCRAVFFGAEPVLLDLSASQSGWSSFYVCRVIQPHAFRKEWDASSPFLGGKRLNSRMSNLTHVNLSPHPYS